MRLTKRQCQKNRRKIVEVAARLFRQRGIDAVSVADLMKEAGFTHGGFYNHFASKEELVAEAGRAAFAKSMAMLSGLSCTGKNNREFVKSLNDYLSPAHRDNCAGGCPAAGFAGEVSHQGLEMQSAYADGIKAFLEVYQTHAAVKNRRKSKAAARRQAIELLSNLIGSLTLARAVAKADPLLSDEFLTVGRQRLPK
jgi:TetR/AcrR family transcriptional repressor of nem operon